MLIDDLVEYCDEQYQSGECGACTGKDRCVNECDGNCKLCLDDIHFHEQQRRTQYDCERLLYYYVCRYSYKYCSEMIYALRQIDLSDYPYFHILSMGCGGAPDLMAFQYMNYPQKLSYVGLDKNVYWEEIHNFIIDNYDDGKVQFLRNIDVLQYFDNREITKCNVIIIQYLISYFYSNVGVRGVRRWFSKLAQSIVKNKLENSPMLIIINDVDSINTGRDAFPIFVEEIERVGLTVNRELRRRFKSVNHFANSVQYASKKNIFDGITDDFQKDYCVALSCESAQLILEVY